MPCSLKIAIFGFTLVFKYGALIDSFISKVVLTFKPSEIFSNSLFSDSEHIGLSRSLEISKEVDDHSL